MPYFVRVTPTDASYQIVNLDSVEAISPTNDGGATILFACKSLVVKEAPQAIVQSEPILPPNERVRRG